jgi:hypothetical protein
VPDRGSGTSLLQLLQFYTSTTALPASAAACVLLGWQMDEQEVAYAIGWLLIASGVLAVTFSSLFSRHGYMEPPPPGYFLASWAC